MKRALLAVVLIGCGGDDGDGHTVHHDASVVDGSTVDSKLVDAAPLIDAPPDAQAFVLAVTCPGTVDATVVTDGNSYLPASVTLSLDAIVKFEMPPNHDVRPDPSTTTDPGLRVLFNETRCLQFTAVGTFGYLCGPHQFKGSVTITN